MNVTHVLYTPVGIYLLTNGRAEGKMITCDAYLYASDRQGQALSIPLTPIGTAGSWNNDPWHTLVHIDSPLDLRW